MKNIDKNDLKKVSGSVAWCAPWTGSNGKSYFLDEEACNTLEAKGYNIRSNKVYTPSSAMWRRRMFAMDVTDANGNGIGDAAMQNLLGAPIR